jgi:hypothetical protein
VEEALKVQTLPEPSIAMLPTELSEGSAKLMPTLRGTGVVAGDGEATAGVGDDVGAERVGGAGGGCVEE